MADQEIRKYTCDYCGYSFTKKVGIAIGDGGPKGVGKKRHVSSQVKCRCGNFLKTWEDK